MSDNIDQRPPFPGQESASQDVAPQAPAYVAASAEQAPTHPAPNAAQTSAGPTASSSEQPTQQVTPETTAQVPQPSSSDGAAAPSWYEAASQRAAARTEGDATGTTYPFANVAPTERFATPAEAAPAADAAQAGAVPPVGTVPPGASSDNGAKDPKHHKKHELPRAAKMVAWGLLGGVIGAGALSAVLLGTGVIGASTASTTSTSQQVTIDPSDEDTTLANAVAAKALPSVVSINVTSSSSSGVGSGVILDTDGNILTNNHVIEDAESISVSVNGQSYDATVVGTDESSDLAVLKIDPNGATLTPIEVGDSSALQVGDWVMSIGSPFGLEQSVSTGIVSSLYRSTMLQSSTGNSIYTNLIQTDAAINPGNSGGALVNSEGKLVGINSIIESSSGSSSGVGFAIPGNYAVEVAQKLIAGETVTHAYLGGTFQTVTATNALRNNLSVNQGAYVASVEEGSPAETAGLQTGDIITAIDDEAITSSDGVVLAVRSHSVGDTVTIKFMRGTQEMSVEATLGSDEELQKQQAAQQQDSSDTSSLLEQYLNQYGYGRGRGGSYEEPSTSGSDSDANGAA